MTKIEEILSFESVFIFFIRLENENFTLNCFRYHILSKFKVLKSIVLTQNCLDSKLQSNRKRLQNKSKVKDYNVTMLLYYMTMLLIRYNVMFVNLSFDSLIINNSPIESYDHKITFYT